MGIFLSSALLVASLAQQPATGSPSDSLAALRARVARDSSDGRAWFELGRATWRALADAHAHRAAVDTAWVGATAAEASHAFARAATIRAGTSAGDSARALEVFVWSEATMLGWELGDTAGAAALWARAPSDLHLPPVLGELAENLLRACPRGALILTESEPVTSAAWALRYGRGMRPDLLTIPLERLPADSVLADRVAAATRIRRPSASAGADEWVAAVSERRPVCAGPGLESPPGGQGHTRWRTRAMVFVTGPAADDDTVAAADFVFAALKLALDAHDSWAPLAIEIYRRAIRLTPALCRAVVTDGVPKSVLGCR